MFLMKLVRSLIDGKGSTTGLPADSTRNPCSPRSAMAVNAYSAVTIGVGASWDLAPAKPS